MQKIRDHSKHRPVFFRWFVSYALILIIPLMLGVIMQRSSEADLLDTYTVSIANVQLQVSKVLDSTVQRMKAICKQLSVDDVIRQFANLDYTKAVEQRYGLSVIQKKMKYDQIILDIDGNHVLIFFNHLNLYVSSQSVYNEDDLFRIVIPELAEDKQEWHNNVLRGHNFDMHVFRMKNGMYSAFMMYSIPSYTSSEPVGTIFVRLDDLVLSNLLNEVHFDATGTVLLIDGNRHVIISDNNSYYEKILPFERLNDTAGQLLTTVDGKKTWILYSSSSIPGWKYITLLLPNAFEAITVRSRLITGALVLFSIIIGFAFLYNVTKRNYTPLRNVLKNIHASFPQIPSEINEMDEYGKILIAFERIRDARNDIEKLWLSQQERLRQEFFSSLLQGKVSDSSFSNSIARSLEINSEDKLLFMAVFPESGAHSDFMTIPEQLESNLKLYTVQLDSSMVLLILAEKSFDSEQKTRLEEAIRDGLNNEGRCVFMSLDDLTPTEIAKEYRQAMANLGLSAVSDMPKSSTEYVASADEDNAVMGENEKETIGQQNSYLENKIIQCIQSHYMEADFNVTMLAANLNMNLSYLSKYFKDHTGIGLNEYINRTRIEHAKQLMSDTSMAVFQIAEQVGITNASSFNRIFKKYENATPSQFREQNQPIDN